MIKVSQLQTGFSNGKQHTVLIENLSFEVGKGQLIAVVGKNGSGKTTLLKTIYGQLAPLSGFISFNGVNLGTLSVKMLAELVSIVNTEKVRLNYLTVKDLVGMGRFLHTGWTGSINEQDLRIVDEALALVGGSDLSEKTLAQLSDGEHQKAMIARAIAQQTPFMILDEPTAHLDLINRVEITMLLQQLTKEQQRGILFSTHELELAFNYADQMILLDGKGSYYKGTPDQLIDDRVIEKIYGSDHIRFNPETRRFEY